MYKRKMLKCQNNIPSYPYVPQEMWQKNDIGEQNFQIASNIKIYEGLPCCFIYQP